MQADVDDAHDLAESQKEDEEMDLTQFNFDAYYSLTKEENYTELVNNVKAMEQLVDEFEAQR